MEVVQRKDGPRFREKIYINGKAKQSPYFKRKSDASKWKQRESADKEKFKYLGVDYIPDKTVKDFAVNFMSKKEFQQKKTYDFYSNGLDQYLIPLFGHLKLKNIKLCHAEELKQHMASLGKGNVRINNLLRVFKNFMNEAVRSQFLLVSPFANLKFIKVQARELTYWMPHEISKFLTTNCLDFYYPLYVVALNTGMRKGEILGLCWDCVDFSNRQLLVKRSASREGLKETTKSNKPRYIKMNDVVYETLLNLRGESNSLSYVFLNQKGLPVDYEHFTLRAFDKAIKRAKVSRIRFHDLRTTFASNFCMNGGNIFALSKILGHSSVQITQDRYAHLHPNFMQNEAQVVAFKAQCSPEIALKII